MSNPTKVHSKGTELFVADSGNSRVLVFDALPTANQPAADHVLDQSNFTHVIANGDDQNGASDATPTGRTLKGPLRVLAAGYQLFVNDLGNHRIVIFEGL